MRIIMACQVEPCQWPSSPSSRQALDFAVEDHCQGGAPAAKRGRTTLTVIFARRQNARCGRTARPLLQARSPRVRNGEDLQAAGAGVARGGSGPRRCARARGSGPSCRPAAARLPATPAARSAVLSPVHALPPGEPTRPCPETRSGPDGPARRRRALEAVEKVVTDSEGARKEHEGHTADGPRRTQTDPDGPRQLHFKGVCVCCPA
jgi:hypothetical protein